MGSVLSSPSSHASRSSMSKLMAAFMPTAYKMVFVVNTDLEMGRGKQCAQVAHAALGLYLDIQRTGSDLEQCKLISWIDQGQKKIVLKGDNLQQLKKLETDAKALGLSNHLVCDAGCTQIPAGSKTVLSIFGSNEDVDKVTGELRLL